MLANSLQMENNSNFGFQGFGILTVEPVMEVNQTRASFGGYNYSNSLFSNQVPICDYPSPSFDAIFETRLHQLYQNLNAMEFYASFENNSTYCNCVHDDAYEVTRSPVASAKKFSMIDMGELKEETTLESANLNSMIASEVQVPYEKLEIRNLSEHYTQNLEPISIKKKCVKRGRKRVNVLPAINFSELLNSIVLPKWVDILKNKTLREGEPLGQVTDEYLWIKVLRDMRDFFRIIFKSRFHRSEKRDDSNRDLLVKIFLEELGITDAVYINTISIFDFLYKAHYKARSTNEGKKFREIINSTPMRIYYYYSETFKNKFLQDDLCSRLLYYFLFNFGEMYLECVQSNLKEGIAEIIRFVVSSCKNTSSF